MFEPRRPTQAAPPVDVTEPARLPRHRTAESAPSDPAADPEVRALFDDFAARTAVRAPATDLPGLRSRSSRRQAAQWAAAAAAAAALVVPVAVYALTRPAVDTPVVAPIGATPEPPSGVIGVAPTQSTTAPAAQVPPVAQPEQSLTLPPTRQPEVTVQASVPSVPTGPTGPISGIDWRNATIQIPENTTGCAAGAATFVAGVATVGASRYQLGGGQDMAFAPAYGNVDGDESQAEALLMVSCVTAPHTNPPSLVLLLGASPTLHTMAVAFSSEPRSPDGDGRSEITSLAISPDGTITFDVRNFEGMAGCTHKRVWNGTALTGGCALPSPPA